MAEKKNSDARIRANNKYAAAHYDRINMALPKGSRRLIEYCAKNMVKASTAMSAGWCWSRSVKSFVRSSRKRQSETSFSTSFSPTLLD